MVVIAELQDAPGRGLLSAMLRGDGCQAGVHHQAGVWLYVGSTANSLTASSAALPLRLVITSLTGKGKIRGEGVF